MDGQTANGNVPQLILDLPVSGCKVSMNQYMTTGQSRQLKRFLLESTKMDSEGKMTDLHPESYLIMQDKAAELLITNITGSDGNVLPFTLDWLNDLPQDDGDVIYQAIDERMKLSKLSKDDKKK